MSFLDDDLVFVFSASNPLADAVVITTSAGAATKYGMFDEAYLGTPMTGAVPIENSIPSVQMRASDYATHVHTDTALVRSTTYKIRRREIEADGRTIRLFLGVD